MKKIILLLCLSFATTVHAENHIKGKINLEEGSVKLLKRISPFDYNVTLVSNAQITNGQFECSFDLEEDTEITIEVGGIMVTRNIFADANWDVELEIQDLSKPDFEGNMTELIIDSFVTDNPLEAKIHNVEQDIQTIKDQHSKGNGRLKKSYDVALDAYLKKIANNNSKAFHTKFANSGTVSFQIFRKTAIQNHWLKNYFAENFEFTQQNISGIELAYTIPIQDEMLTSKLSDAELFDFISKSVLQIENPKVRAATHAFVLAGNIGRKWMDQDRAFSELNAFIDKCEYPKLKNYLLAFQKFHSSNLIGTELRDLGYEGIDLDETKFSDFKGKYLLLDFWATWCGPCVKSMKKLPAMKEKYQNLEVLCITDEKEESKIRRFIKNRGYVNTLKFGISDNYKEVESYFNIRAIPLYFLVDPNGVIIDKAVSDPISMLEKHLSEVN